MVAQNTRVPICLIKIFFAFSLISHEITSYRGCFVHVPMIQLQRVSVSSLPKMHVLSSGTNILWNSSVKFNLFTNPTVQVQWPFLYLKNSWPDWDFLGPFCDSCIFFSRTFQNVHYIALLIQLGHSWYQMTRSVNSDPYRSYQALYSGKVIGVHPTFMSFRVQV